jgi:hypothetical protein
MWWGRRSDRVRGLQNALPVDLKPRSIAEVFGLGFQRGSGRI